MSSWQGFLLEGLSPLSRSGNDVASAFSSVAPAAATSVRGSGWSLPTLPSQPLQVDIMATVLKNHCLVCLDICGNSSYMMPCLHQFFFQCIQQWAKTKPKRSLCKRRVSSILHLVRTETLGSSLLQHLKGYQSSSTRQEELLDTWALDHRLQVQGFHGWPPTPHTWAYLFSQHPAILQLLLPWLHHKLEQILGAGMCSASAVQCLITSSLCFCSLDEEVLTVLLYTCLRGQTDDFVQQFFATAVQQCSRDDSHDARGHDSRPSPCCLPSGNSCP